MKPDLTPFHYEPPTEYKTLDDLCAQAIHFAQFALRRLGHVEPTLLILSVDEPPSFLIHQGDDFGDQKCKNRWRDECRLFGLAHGAHTAVMVLETWIVMRSAPVTNDMDKVAKELAKENLPSEQLDRQEYITLLTEVAGEPAGMKLLPIIRDGRGTFFGLGEIRIMPGYQADGRFVPMLQKEPSPEKREIAKFIMAQKSTPIGYAPKGKK